MVQYLDQMERNLTHPGQYSKNDMADYDPSEVDKKNKKSYYGDALKKR